MNPKDYAEKAITIEKLFFSPETPIEEAADVCLRSGYPEPKYGVVLYGGRRGEVNGSIDWGVDHLRRGIAEIIESVAEDCISVVSQLNDIPDEARSKIANAIRQHFEIENH
jgi:hypothetical protein